MNVESKRIPIGSVDGATQKVRVRRQRFAFLSNTWTLPYIYLILALITTLTVCFLVPPMQALDENRHFMRSVQFSQGNWMPQLDLSTNRAGGILPDTVFEFVRLTMGTEFLQGEETLHTVRERLNALDRASLSDAASSRMTFGAFPTASIYPPGLYIPQTAGIWMARRFTDKVYIWFYSARVCNAVSAVLLVFLALRMAGRSKALYLLIPAALPMTLYQFGSVSCDAGIIALSILFVVLCLRFLGEDTITLRIGIILCLVLLVLGKPVHVVLGLLLLAAHTRLGWRRAISFCCLASGVAVACYAGWLVLVRSFIVLAGEGVGDAGAQVRFILAHPVSLLKIMNLTFRNEIPRICKEFVGVFGWAEVPLPLWFYGLSVLGFACIVFLLIFNYKKMKPALLAFGVASIVGLVLAVFIAGYVLWNRPGAPVISLIQGRYFIPALPIIAFFAPPLPALGLPTRAILQTACLGYFLFSTYTTVRLVDRCYFSSSPALGKNIHNLFLPVSSSSSCPAFLEDAGKIGSWFGFVSKGRAESSGDYRVLFAAEDGTILSESDPALTGREFPYRLLPGISPTHWKIHIWRMSKVASGRLWLVRGHYACMFGPQFNFQPFTNSDPKAILPSKESQVLLQ